MDKTAKKLESFLSSACILFTESNNSLNTSMQTCDFNYYNFHDEYKAVDIRCALQRN